MKEDIGANYSKPETTGKKTLMPRISDYGARSKRGHREKTPGEKLERKKNPKKKKSTPDSDDKLLWTGGGKKRGRSAEMKKRGA